MNNLAEMVLSNRISNQSDLNKYYEENAKGIGTRINTKATIFGIIEDYKKAVALLNKRNITIVNEFNSEIFNQILSKIKSIGITNWKTEISDYKLYRNYLIEEVTKKNADAALSFKRILSDENIIATNKEVLYLFYQGFSHYVETAVNLHQYTKVTVEQNNRIGRSCFDEMKNKYRDHEMKEDIENVKKFLNNLIEEILINKEYKS